MLGLDLPETKDDAELSGAGAQIPSELRFEDLIGQDAMVKTLTNAFKSGRIAHAYMLTGVREVSVKRLRHG